MEDTLKGVRNTKEAIKASIARKFDEIERDLEFTNELLYESGVPEEDLLSPEQLFPPTFEE